MDGYMTLTEAAQKLGLKDASGLRHAAARGILRTERVGRLHVTRQEWLDAYVTHVVSTRGGRGEKRGPRHILGRPNTEGEGGTR